ncbi:MAG: cold-shock protein [Shimia sp.]
MKGGAELGVSMSEAQVVSGVVKWFDLGKGFGFVVADGIPQDVMLHVNVVRKHGASGVMAGDKVRISAVASERGWQTVELLEVESVAMPDALSLREIDPKETALPARLKWFDKGKGYGFLNVFGEPDDVFVHIDVLRAGGMSEAAVGEAMCVTITRGAKGASAKAVYPWDSALAWSKGKVEAGG